MKTIKEILKECGALLEGHFLLTSGRHGKQYLEKAEICADPAVTADFCWEIAQSVVSQFKALDENRIEVVVGLAPIGAILSNRLAEYLGEIYQKKVISVFTEKDGPSAGSLRGPALESLDPHGEESDPQGQSKAGQGDSKMVFKRGYAKKIFGKNVLIVDDILTTGGSVGLVKKEIERLGGRVIGAAVICQRGRVRSEDLAGTPILSLLELKLEDCLPEECPQCQEHIPLIDPKFR